MSLFAKLVFRQAEGLDGDNNLLVFYSSTSRKSQSLTGLRKLVQVMLLSISLDGLIASLCGDLNSLFIITLLV